MTTLTQSYQYLTTLKQTQQLNKIMMQIHYFEPHPFWSKYTILFCSPSLNSLWFDWVIRSFLQKIIDVVVVDFYVGDKHAVAAVLIHTICLASLLWLNHVTKFRLGLLSASIKIVNYMWWDECRLYDLTISNIFRQITGNSKHFNLLRGGSFGHRWLIFPSLALQQSINFILCLHSIFIICLENLNKSEEWHKKLLQIHKAVTYNHATLTHSEGYRGWQSSKPQWHFLTYRFAW